MLYIYRRQDDRLAPTDVQGTAHLLSPGAQAAVWLDLINPSREEDHFIERLLGVSIPTKEEAQEIEVSARLYHEDGAEFMTMTGVSQIESGTHDDTDHLPPQRRDPRYDPLRATEAVSYLCYAGAEIRSRFLRQR